MSPDELKKNEPRIDSRLWAEFNDADEREEYCRCWLSLQCSILSNVRQGIVVLSDPEKMSYSPQAIWPEEGGNPEKLTDIAERVLEEKCGLLIELDQESSGSESEEQTYGIAYPILTDDHFYGLVAIEITAESEDHLKYTMEQLQWGTSWMEVMLWREKKKKSDASFKRLKTSVDLLAEVLSEEKFTGASFSFVTKLATCLECDRVSLGLIKDKKIKIQAVSHSSRIADNMNLIRSVILAMEEAVTQGKEIYYPPFRDENRIIRDHEALARKHGAAHILTISVLR